MKRKTVIQIQSMSQWYLLRQLNYNGILNGIKLPEEIMRKLFYMLKSRQLGKNGYIVLCLESVYDDWIGMEEVSGVYPCRLHLDDRIDEVKAFRKGRKESWMISYATIQQCGRRIVLIYRMKE